MTINKNTLREQEELVEEQLTESTQDEKVKSSKFFTEFIGGGVLSRETVLRQFPFILYVVLLAILLISNTFAAEDMARDIAKKRQVLGDKHVEYIYIKSKITELTKQSVLSERLKNKGIKESVEPLKKISNISCNVGSEE